MSALDAVVPLALPDEERVVWARRSQADAQALLSAGGAELSLPLYYDLAWFGSAALVDRGSFALVDPDGVLGEYVGDDLRLTNEDGGSLVVYVVGSQDMGGVPIAVTRRSFLALAPLYLDSVRVRVEVMA
jgi:hypothetical protein